MVAVRVWGEQWAGTSVRVACANEAVVIVLTSGHTRCPHLTAISRNILCMQHDIKLHIIHIAGKQNQVADLLSRWTGSVEDKKKFKNLKNTVNWDKVQPHHVVVDHTI